MRYLTLAEVVWLHRQLIDATGGASGLRDLPALESSLAQPKAAFGGTDLYRSLIDKAAALAYSLVLNHPFIDGNKRIGHAAMDVFLRINGYDLIATTEEQEQLFLSLAAGNVVRDDMAHRARSPQLTGRRTRRFS